MITSMNSTHGIVSIRHFVVRLYKQIYAKILIQGLVSIGGVNIGE